MIDPLQGSDRLVDLLRSQGVKALAVGLEFCHVIEFRMSFFVDLLLKADDSTSTVTDRQDLASVVKRYGGEQVLLVDVGDVRFAELILINHVHWLNILC